MATLMMMENGVCVARVWFFVCVRSYEVCKLQKQVVTKHTGFRCSKCTNAVEETGYIRPQREKALQNDRRTPTTGQKATTYK